MFILPRVRLLLLLCLAISAPIFSSSYRAQQSFHGTIPGSPIFGSGFGTVVHLHQNENYLFISAPFARAANEVVAGAVYVYKRVQGDWELLQILETDGVTDHLGSLNVYTEGKWLFISAIGTPIGPGTTILQQNITGAIAVYKFSDQSEKYEFRQLIDKNIPGLEGLTPTSLAGLDVTIPAFFNQQGASFGLTFSVNVKRGLLLVGAQYQQHSNDTGTLINSGSVYALKLSENDEWTFLQEIVSPDGPAANDTFGANVKMCGDLAIITNGSIIQIPRLTIPPFLNPPLPNTNSAVYVYQFRDCEWNFVQKLMGDQQNPAPIQTPLFCPLCTPQGCPIPCPYPAEISDSFGSSLALNCHWAVIGAGLEQLSPNGPLSGAAYIYRVARDHEGNKSLVRTQKIVSDDPNAQGFALLSLALNNKTLLISDPTHVGPQGQAQQGAFHVYNLKKGKWVFSETIFDPDGGASEFFGFGVSATKNYILAGSGTFVTGVLFLNFGNPVINTPFPFQDGTAVVYKKKKC